MVLLGPWLLLLLCLPFAGRFMSLRRGGEIDLLVMLVVYPLGPAIAGLFLGLVQPWLRQPWVAILAGIPAGIAWLALISLAFQPHGPNPYSVDWIPTSILGPLFGAVAGAFAHDLIPIQRRRRRWIQRQSS
jgi:hypothetical protein